MRALWITSPTGSPGKLRIEFALTPISLGTGTGCGETVGDGARRSSEANDSNKRGRKASLAVKRAMDASGSAILLLLLAPLLLLIAVLISLQRDGPVIYRRRVVGRDGEFDAFKFRSMRSDADSVLHRNPKLLAEFQRNYKLVADPRVTRLGRFLRKFSLDELPQLFNVFRGEMSLIGPRMITRPELEKYGPARDLLLAVKPGLTGYWQVGGRQEISYEERVRMDVFYITHWSLWLDFKILLKTPLAVLKRQGAF